MPKQSPYPFGGINPPHHGSVAFVYKSVEDGRGAFSKYGSRYAYGRMGNPSVQPLEEWLAEFHGLPAGSVWATNTGMTALDLVIRGSTLKDVGWGKKIVASPYLYGGTFHLLELLDRNGYINLVWVENPFDLSSWEIALNGKTAAIAILETPANPTIDIFDIRAIATTVHTWGSRLVVDDTLAVGLQKPFELGADCCVYSVTKGLNRKSSHLGGAVVANPSFRSKVEAVFDDLFVHSGMIIDPGSAIAVYQNRATLVRDMELFSEHALIVALFLQKHKKIKKVNYPFLKNSKHYHLAHQQMTGGGGVLSFEMHSFDDAVKFVELQSEAYLGVHLGDGNNHLVTHPASTTHSKLSEEELNKLNITPGLIRLSVGLDEKKMSPLLANFKNVLDQL
ncbi:MAG: PLP-dependent transferase [Parcubacteria group bacterium]|nr:PLP-dependent transferase [Parcubacteria group bacterium]